MSTRALPLWVALVFFISTAQAPGASAVRARSRLALPIKIHHIVVVIQENRTLDDMFNGFCVALDCADTVAVDPATGTPLVETSLAAPFGASHAHKNFVLQYDYGKMDGFPQTKALCRHRQPSCPYSIMAYAPASETKIYRRLATVEGVLSDETFQPDQGPSFPSHLYAIAGQSGGFEPDHLAIISDGGTCGKQKQVWTLDMTTPFPGQPGPRTASCKDFRTIFDLLEHNGRSWRYYSDRENGFWSPTQSIAHLYNSPNFVVPSTQFLTDVANGVLADVTFVMPWTGRVSDHPNMIDRARDGPDWVASIVDAVGATPFWNDTAIAIFWDDWGGLYDHVPPPAAPLNPDPFEYGFRVPLLVVSPYANVGTIDHTPRTFVSVLRLIERTFHVGTLRTLDQYEPDNLEPAFNFRQAPLPFVPVGGRFRR